MIERAVLGVLQLVDAIEGPAQIAGALGVAGPLEEEGRALRGGHCLAERAIRGVAVALAVHLDRGVEAGVDVRAGAQRGHERLGGGIELPGGEGAAREGGLAPRIFGVGAQVGVHACGGRRRVAAREVAGGVVEQPAVGREALEDGLPGSIAVRPGEGVGPRVGEVGVAGEALHAGGEQRGLLASLQALGEGEGGGAVEVGIHGVAEAGQARVGDARGSRARAWRAR